MRVFHFLPARFALEDIKLRRLKLSRYPDLNDPFELYGATFSSDSDERVASRFREYFNNNSLLCFSRNWHDPLLWAHYAEKHHGICLGFDVQDEQLLDVKYLKAPQELVLPDIRHGDFKDEQQKMEWKLSQTEELWHAIALSKYEGWMYEDEVRVLSTARVEDRENGFDFIPFEPNFRLRDVILGVRCEKEAAVRALLREGGFDSVTVIKAKLGEQRFTVIAS